MDALLLSVKKTLGLLAYNPDKELHFILLEGEVQDKLENFFRELGPK